MSHAKDLQEQVIERIEAKGLIRILDWKGHKILRVPLVKTPVAG